MLEAPVELAAAAAAAAGEADRAACSAWQDEAAAGASNGTGKKMDHSQTNGHVEPGISLSNGPVTDKSTGGPLKGMTNGSSNKRKASTGKSYAPESDSDDDDIPLVSQIQTPLIFSTDSHR